MRSCLLMGFVFHLKTGTSTPPSSSMEGCTMMFEPLFAGCTEVEKREEPVPESGVEPWCSLTLREPCVDSVWISVAFCPAKRIINES